jgi:hypothetical protein
MVLSTKYARTRTTPLIIGCAASIAIMLLPPLDAVENSNLTVRMVEDVLLFIYAIMIGYAAEARSSLGTTMSSVLRVVHSITSRINRQSKGLIFAIVIPSILLAYWNYPTNLDLTATNIVARYASEILYVACAVLAGTSIGYIPGKFRVLLLLFAFMSIGMMGSMMVVYQPGFYAAYSPAQNTTMNTFMMLFGAVGVVVVSPWLMKVLDIF